MWFTKNRTNKHVELVIATQTKMKTKTSQLIQLARLLFTYVF